MILVAVIAAGILGAVLRYLVTTFAPSWGVLAVNVVGSFLGGIAIGALSGDARLILLTGFCGGLTTFSTFSVETVQAVLDGRVRRAALGVAANLVLGIGAAALGYVLVA
jgi:CrcB protein